MSRQSTEGLNCFELFGLEPVFDIDIKALRHKYLSLTRAIHPDRQSQDDQNKHRHARILSSDLNGAYETLRDPVARAEHLLNLAGGPTPEDDRSVPSDVLAEVMAIREAIEEAQTSSDAATMAALKRRITTQRQATLDRIAALGRSLRKTDVLGLSSLRQSLNATKYWRNLLDQLPAGEDTQDASH